MESSDFFINNIDLRMVFGGKHVRLSMSHTSGKIEILAIEEGKAYWKYYQSRDHEYGKFIVLECPGNAAWFDDLLGNEQYGTKPEKKTEEVVLVNKLAYMPKKKKRAIATSK